MSFIPGSIVVECARTEFVVKCIWIHVASTATKKRKRVSKTPGNVRKIIPANPNFAAVFLLTVYIFFNNIFMAFY
jgi:hypothetical protein